MSNKTEAHCYSGLHILMFVCSGGPFCWLCPDIHSHTIAVAKDASDAPSTQIKEGCATLLWAYLRDYQHENTTSQSPVGGRSVIVSCQTSTVPLTASYLTFSSNEFIFHYLVFWRQCHLWPNLVLFFHHVYCKPMIKVCENCTLYKKRMLPPSRKGHIRQLMNDQM